MIATNGGNDTSQVPRLALRPNEMARALGISPGKLAQMDVPVVRDGRAMLYPIDTTRHWLARRAGVIDGELGGAT